jgi:hypothetical protein
VRFEERNQSGVFGAQGADGFSGRTRLHVVAGRHRCGVKVSNLNVGDM